MAEEWKLQVSYKIHVADMVNVRANTADELSVLLEGISDYSTQIAATGRMLNGASVTAPLGTTTTTPVTQAVPTFVTAPPQAPSSTPTCVHGPRTFRQGTSQKTGNPYAFWGCPAPMGPGQCKPVN